MTFPDPNQPPPPAGQPYGAPLAQPGGPPNPQAVPAYNAPTVPPGSWPQSGASDAATQPGYTPPAGYGQPGYAPPPAGYQPPPYGQPPAGYEQPPYAQSGGFPPGSVPPPGVWPPPPGYYPQPQAGFSFYQSARGFLPWVISLQVIAILFLVAEAVVRLSSAVTADMISLWSAPATMLGGLAFLMWTYRSYKNLQALGVQGLSSTPGWAVGYFFVPILCLYRPYMIFAEMFRASRETVDVWPQSWQAQPAAPLVQLWWTASILTLVVGIASGVLQGQTGATGSTAAILLDLATNALSVAEAVLTILVVRALTTQEDNRAIAAGMLGPPGSR